MQVNDYEFSHQRGREAANRIGRSRLQHGSCYRNRARPLGLAVAVDRSHPNTSYSIPLIAHLSAI